MVQLNLQNEKGMKRLNQMEKKNKEKKEKNKEKEEKNKEKKEKNKEKKEKNKEKKEKNKEKKEKKEKVKRERLEMDVVLVMKLNSKNLEWINPPTRQHFFKFAKRQFQKEKN